MIGAIRCIEGDILKCTWQHDHKTVGAKACAMTVDINGRYEQAEAVLFLWAIHGTMCDGASHRRVARGMEAAWRARCTDQS